MYNLDPRTLEPSFSLWMNKLTEDNLIDKADLAMVLAKLSEAIRKMICDVYKDQPEMAIVHGLDTLQQLEFIPDIAINSNEFDSFIER